LLTKELQSALNKYLPKKGKLARAMRYSVFAGGKRFRPLLCFATAKALGKNPKNVIPIAATVEMLHTFTLIHDDLPGMDNSNYRRGKPTCHKKFGEATAILAGNALNTLAFEILAREIKDPRVAEEIGHALMEVVEGQIMDLEFTGKKLTFSKLKTIHRYKTAALLMGCVRASAIHLKASTQQRAALTLYAKHLGLAFQIADDILDVTSTRKKLGKPVKADVNKGFPYFVGVERSRRLAEQEKNKGILALKRFGRRADILRDLIVYVIERKK
jgi:geranylgeranyl diphosphate synthase type II